MEKITHIAFGVFIFSLLAYFLDYNFIYLIPLAIGAIIPDIDIKFKHRKILHNIWILSGIAIAIGYYYNWRWGILFSIGWISHLILDSLTPMGIYPFWPMRYHFRIKSPIVTGNVYELFFFFVIVTLTVLVFAEKYRWQTTTVVAAILATIGYVTVKKKLPIKF